MRKDLLYHVIDGILNNIRANEPNKKTEVTKMTKLEKQMGLVNYLSGKESILEARACTEDTGMVFVKKTYGAIGYYERLGVDWKYYEKNESGIWESAAGVFEE